MPPTPLYDFLFAGGGLSALSLAYRLAATPGLQDRTMLIVDPAGGSALAEHPARSWSFWSNSATPFDSLIQHSWSRLRLVDHDGAQTLDLGPYRYNLIHGPDFHAHVRGVLAQHPNVTFLPARVARIDDGSAAAGVIVDGRPYAGRWVFDSRFRAVDLQRALAPVRAAAARAALHEGLPTGSLRAEYRARPRRAQPYHCLCQHFVGWYIETYAPVFDVETATLFDFRTPAPRRPEARGEWRFFYVLPLSPCRALVEYVTLTPDDADQALAHYLERILGVRGYTVVARECGVNPLTDRPFPRRAGRHVLTLGTVGGRVKPSSGYAFTRIQRDSDAIVRSLKRWRHPFALPADGAFYRLCDALLLDLLAQPGLPAAPLFRRLFANNPPQRVLRFLDERASPLDNLRLMASMPAGLFLRAFARVTYRRLTA
jgi:lycopene beta-cyclase